MKKKKVKLFWWFPLIILFTLGFAFLLMSTNINTIPPNTESVKSEMYGAIGSMFLFFGFLVFIFVFAQNKFENWVADKAEQTKKEIGVIKKAFQ